jgi:hypothetical protein
MIDGPLPLVRAGDHDQQHANAQLHADRDQ